MTAKRFYLLNYNNHPIYDSLNDKEYNAQFKAQREKLCLLLNDLSEENEQLKKQMQRLYNYFVDWHGDIMGANQFSEMWDVVKEDENWEL